jgi:sec-independent protein translocase protein TatA
MPGLNLGGFEIIIILGIVILLFGVGRIGKIGGELGKSIREFRRGLQDGDEAKPADKATTSAAATTATEPEQK